MQFSSSSFISLRNPKHTNSYKVVTDISFTYLPEEKSGSGLLNFLPHPISIFGYVDPRNYWDLGNYAAHTIWIELEDGTKIDLVITDLVRRDKLSCSFKVIEYKVLYQSH